MSRSPHTFLHVSALIQFHFSQHFFPEHKNSAVVIPTKARILEQRTEQGGGRTKKTNTDIPFIYVLSRRLSYFSEKNDHREKKGEEEKIRQRKKKVDHCPHSD